MFARSNVSLNAYFGGVAQWNGSEIKQRGIALGRGIATLAAPGGGTVYSGTPDPEELFEETFDQPESFQQQQTHTHGNLRIVIHWSILGVSGPDESIRESKAALTHAAFLGRLIAGLGRGMSDKLQQIAVARSYPLSAKPEQDFINPAAKETYSYKPVPGTPLSVFTNTSTSEKRRTSSRFASDSVSRPAEWRSSDHAARFTGECVGRRLARKDRDTQMLPPSTHEGHRIGRVHSRLRSPPARRQNREALHLQFEQDLDKHRSAKV